MKIRYFAAAAAAAGVEEESLELLPGATLADVSEQLGQRHPNSASQSASNLQQVLSRSTFLVNGVARRDLSQTLLSDDVIDVLPPFAGG